MFRSTSPRFTAGSSGRPSENTSVGTGSGGVVATAVVAAGGGGGDAGNGTISGRTTSGAHRPPVSAPVGFSSALARLNMVMASCAFCILLQVRKWRRVQ